MTQELRVSDLSSILDTFANDAGLSADIKPFPSEGTLAERFAKAPLLMAPMAGVTDPSYRLMARAGGANLAYTEMVSVTGIHYAGEKTWELVYPSDAEPDIAVQLFGTDLTHFAEAAEQVQERLGDKLALVDVNMACPVPKVTKKGEGSALMDNPEHAAKIIKTLKSHLNVPVTAKIRRGRRMGEEQAPEFARALEAAGVDALAVHGRFAEQFYSGKSDTSTIDRVIDAVSVPVIGSGDMTTPEAIKAMLDRGCAAVMVARGTYGNPWIFKDAKQFIESGSYAPHSLEERFSAFVCHLQLLSASDTHFARARQLSGWYLRGVPDAAYWRNKAMSCNSLQEYIDLIEDVKTEARGALHE